MRILALDIGTSHVEAAVLDVEKAAPVGPVARSACVPDQPTPEASELPCERVWQAVSSASRQATRGVEGVAGVGMACLTPALVLLDQAERPLSPAWTHLDRRSRPAARQVWADVGEEFLRTTGNRPLPGGISALCWRQQLTDEPYLIRNTKHYLHLNGWLGLRMTGERAFDPANASFSGLFHTMTDQRWSERWCEYFRIEMGWLPPVVNGDTTLGTLRSAAAADLGVPAGVPVKLGTADTSSALLACGMGPNDLLHVVGTTQVLAAVTTTPKPGPKHLTRLLGVGDAYVHVTHNPVGGVALDWLHQLCFRDQTEREYYETTIPAALAHPTRITLDPPHLGGDRLEIEAHRAAFRGLTLATDRLDLLAATLEAMRRHHREALLNLGLGERFGRIFLTGGGAEVVHRLLPEYAGASVHSFQDGSLLGVAHLFRSAGS